MDIHHFTGKKAHTETCWVFTQKGYDHLLKKGTSLDNLADRKPGMPVAEFYRKSCPMWWFHNGWVEELQAEGKASLS